MHRRLKEALKTRLVGLNWFDHLPWVLLGLRTTVKDDLGCSPAELVYGSPIAIPGDCLPTTAAPSTAEHLATLHRAVDRLKPTSTSHHTAPVKPASGLPPSQHVFIRRDGHRAPLSPAYDGPFKVIKQTDKVVTIERGSTTDTISVDRCKPAALEDGTAMQQPLPRGRPPRTASAAPTSPPPVSAPTPPPPVSAQLLPPLRQSQRAARGVPPLRYGVDPPWGEVM